MVGMAIPRPDWSEIGSPVPLGILKCYICKKPVVSHPSPFNPCSLFTGGRLTTTSSPRNAGKRLAHPADSPAATKRLGRS